MRGHGTSVTDAYLIQVQTWTVERMILTGRRGIFYIKIQPVVYLVIEKTDSKKRR